MDRWRVECFLQVHTKVDVVEEELERPLLLRVAAGCAERHEGIAALRNKRGCQRRAGTLARLESVRAVRVQVKHLAASAEWEAESLDYGGSTKPATAWSSRDHVTFGVHCVEVRGISDVGVPEAEVTHFTGADAERGTVVLCDTDSGIVGCSAAEVAGTQFAGRKSTNLPCPFLRIVLGQQHVDGHFIECGIAVVRLAVGECELGGLHPRVQVVGTVVSEAGNVHRLEDCELL